MNQHLLMPNPEDWLSGTGAASLIGVSLATFHRIITASVPPITSYPLQGSTRPMFWRAEVERYAAARRLTRGTADADR